CLADGGALDADESRARRRDRSRLPPRLQRTPRLWRTAARALRSATCSGHGCCYLAWGPAQRPPTQHMQMQMKYRLPCPPTSVVHRAIPVLDLPLALDLCCPQLAISEQLGVVAGRFLQSHDVLLRHDEHVRRRLRIDVLEGERLFVFVDLLRRDLTGDDLAE